MLKNEVQSHQVIENKERGFGSKPKFHVRSLKFEALVRGTNQTGISFVFCEISLAVPVTALKIIFWPAQG